MQVDGICCHVECSGEGQGVVLLHGWGQNCSMMRLVQRELEDRYRVVNLDLPGFGDSVPLKKPMSIKEYAMFVRKLMAELGIEDPIIIAHSFGSRIALRYAMMYPVKCLVLTGAAGIRSPLSLWKKGKQCIYRIFRFFRLPVTAGSRDYRQADDVMRQVLVKAVNDDLSPDLGFVECPTLLVWGSDDRETPLWMGRKMEELLPDARMIIYRHDDHFAYYHQGFRFAKDVKEFLEVSICSI